jgi:hypothetical protein
MKKVKFKHLFLNKWFAIAFGLFLVMTVMWRMADADAPTLSHPAQKQVKTILYSLQDSEADKASGAYHPGSGAFISLDLIRGPNSAKNKASYQGVRDWGIYLLQTFGGRLTEVPAEETISISIDFYDFTQVVYRQIVLSSKAADIKDPSKYKIYLDGKPYDQATGQNKQTAAPTAAKTTAAPGATGMPVATARAAATNKPATSATPAATAQATAAPTAAGPVKVSLDFVDPQTSGKQWKAINGQWSFENGSYLQKELGKFDLVTIFNTPVSGNIKLQAEMKHVEGDMGGGLIFFAPKNDTKTGAQMVSFTGKGSYLQWGYYDNSGIFQYQGGLGITSVADGKTHTLAVNVTGSTYDVILDGRTVGTKVPLKSGTTGYTGLLVSTSQVQFDNFKLEMVQ